MPRPRLERKPIHDAAPHAAFASALRGLIHRRSIPDADLARQCRVSRSLVSMWLHGRKLPSAVTLTRLCVVLGCHPTELMWER